MKKQKEKIFDVLYEVRIEMGPSLTKNDGKSSLIYDETIELLNDKIENQELLNQILKKLEKYDKISDKENEEICKECYKMGYADLFALQKELKTSLQKESENKLEELFETEVEKIAQLTEEDKKFLEEKLKKIDFSDVLTYFDEEKKQKIKLLLDEKFDNVYEEMGELCKKYFKAGVKAWIKLKLAEM